MLKRAKSLTEQAADEIRARIVRGEMPLGAPLSEHLLAGELGVSKTPVREALLQLKMEGLVTIRPQRGTFVFDLTEQEVADLTELRCTIEVAALQLACRRRRDDLVGALTSAGDGMARGLEKGDLALFREHDAAFHQAILDHCGNGFFVACYQSFAFRIRALRARLSGEPGLNARSLSEHRRIVDLLTLGEIEQASTVLAQHVRATACRRAAALSDESAA